MPYWLCVNTQRTRSTTTINRSAVLARTIATANPMFQSGDFPLAQLKITDATMPNAQAATTTMRTETTNERQYGALLLRGASAQRVVLRHDVGDKHPRLAVGRVDGLMRKSSGDHETLTACECECCVSPPLDHDAALSHEPHHFTGMCMPSGRGAWRPVMDGSHGFEASAGNVAALNNLPIAAACLLRM